LVLVALVVVVLQVVMAVILRSVSLRPQAAVGAVDLTWPGPLVVLVAVEALLLLGAQGLEAQELPGKVMPVVLVALILAVQVQIFLAAEAAVLAV
jgi:hypothetical protein